MSILSKVTKGKVKEPLFITAFGPPGVGKTSLAADFPAPIFACLEDGANNVDVSRLPKIESFKMLMEAIEELNKSNHEFKTFVVDSLDHLEPFINEQVCAENGWKNIEEPGYGKGQVLATKVWGDFFSALKVLRKKINVVLICHSQVKPFADPALPASYDRYELKLHKGANALVKENCDAILFASYDTVVSIDKNTKKGKGFGGEERVLFTEYRAHHDGKNRFGLPYKIQLSYKALIDAVEAGNPENIEVLCSQIEGLLTKVMDDALKGKATEQYKAAKEANDVKKLILVRNRLVQLTQE